MLQHLEKTFPKFKIDHLFGSEILKKRHTFLARERIDYLQALACERNGNFT